MRKYVYLFELDSVRITDEEIIMGQKALYDEIVRNGNIVVLTYNQLVDSRGFFSLLRNQEYQEGLFRLFESGAIRISQFGETRTVAQYLLNSIEDDKKFIYSALPLQYSQKRLTALMRRSLTYSDLSEIRHYIKLAEIESEVARSQLEALFVELIDGKEYRTTLLVSDMKLVLENLCSLLEMVLHISTLPDIYISPRNPKEYENLKLWNVLNAVLNLGEVSELPLYADAAELLRGLEAYRAHNQNRSVYIRQIHSAAGKVQDACWQFAQAIVDLCYNYACENSICNISKHYNVQELLDKQDAKPTFCVDFIARMQQYWREGKDGEIRFPLKESNVFVPFEKINDIPKIREAVRLVEYLDYKEPDETEKIARYEHEVGKQQKLQKQSIMIAIMKKLFYAFLCIVIACGVEFAFNWMQDRFDAYFAFDNIVETLLMLFITEAITTFLSHWFPNVLALSDAVGSVMKLIGDMWQVLRNCSLSYRNGSVEGINEMETRNKCVPIRYVRSNALKKYVEWRKKQENGSSRIVESTEYPLADMADPETMEKLIYLEEVYNYRFGMAYESPFNQVVVDPVLKENGGIFPYERVVPRNGNGVVIMTRCNGRWILLRQFRHAIRREQYGFVRGYADSGCTVLENVRRELMEELGAKPIGEPMLLGRMTPDSGLTSGCVFVYEVEIACYEEKTGYEGIRQVISVTDAEFVSLVADGEIDDGYTLGAYLLKYGANAAESSHSD